MDSVIRILIMELGQVCVNLPAGPLVVQEYLLKKGCTQSVRMLPDSTATAEDAAATLGVPVESIGKTIVFGSSAGPIVVVISGTLRVSSSKLTALLEVGKLRKMDAVEVKSVTGFPIGGVSPFGLPVGVKTVVDAGLEKREPIWVAAGHPKAVVQTRFEDLVEYASAITADVAE